MTTLNESRWWDRARPDTGESSEWEAYAAARAADGSSPLGALQESIDNMLAAEDVTAERGSLAWRIAGAVGTFAVGAAFAAMVALTFWGWLS